MASINDFFDKVELQIIRTMKNVLVDAAEASAREMQSDYKKNVVNMAVNRYYDEYRPKRYKRTGNLHKAFNVEFSADGTSIEYGVSGDSSRLNQHFSRSEWHKSGDTWVSRFYDDEFDFESDDNGLPESDWIFSNFLKGIHPIYLVKDGFLENRSVYTSAFERNFNKYNDAYTKRAAFIIIKNIKKQCVKYFK